MPKHYKDSLDFKNHPFAHFQNAAFELELQTSSLREKGFLPQQERKSVHFTTDSNISPEILTAIEKLLEIILKDSKNS